MVVAPLPPLSSLCEGSSVNILGQSEDTRSNYLPAALKKAVEVQAHAPVVVRETFEGQCTSPSIKGVVSPGRIEWIVKRVCNLVEASD